MASLGHILRSLREQHKLTRQQVADLLGVSKRAIGYYEADERTPTIDQLIVLADSYDVSLDYLVGRNRNNEE